jgi:ferric-dicitrate binding protein FerR (iron transport regulator)
MHKDKINHLLQQYMGGQLTESECRELLRATGKDGEAGLLEILQEMMEAEAANPRSIDANTLKTAFDSVIAVDKSREIGTDPIERPSGRISRRLFTGIAAAVILALGTCLYFLSLHKPSKEVAKITPAPSLKNDVPPGGNKAILTLSDGSQIALDSATTGVLPNQGNTRILKIKSGQLAYQTTASDKRQAASEVAYNTISTPRGGQYQLVLADGTKVWLNASSSLRYPVAFAGKERSVELTGEGYFEVEKDEAMPFKVKVNAMEVDVLGTHFNVNAYSDESTIKTTLLEGAVKIKNSHAANILSPGQQAQIAEDGRISIVNNVDMDEVVAWKDGYFQFNQADLKNIMRQISRWYDVDIRYEGGIPDRKFGGDISRTANISEVLNILKISQVHFRIEGRTLILTP